MKVSVAICTYNGERFLREQLESIVSQTRRVDEIIINDDGSGDNTITIIEEFRACYPNLIFYNINIQTLGTAKNFEQAIQKCTGDYIFLSDQDDIWLPDKVETICNLFLANPGVDGFFSDAELIDENGNSLGGTLWESIGVSDNGNLMVDSQDFFQFILMLGNIAAGATIAVRSTALSYIVPFRLSYNSQHDQAIALNLSRRNSFFDTSRPLIKYRVHADQQVGTASKDRWCKNLEIKNKIWHNGFFSVDSDIAIDKSWAYYNRSIVFCDSPETKPIIEEAARVFRKAKSDYLHNFRFIQKRRLLYRWYKRSIYSTSLFEVIFGKG